MGGVLLLLGFLLCGVAAAEGLFRQRCGLIRIWLGLCLGLAMMMWFPALFAFFLDFTIPAQFLGLVLGALCAAAGMFLGRRKPAASVGFFGNVPPGWLAALLIPALLLSGYLQFTHVIREVDGALYVGQSTYGDLCLHLGIATGMRNATFPPDYTILYGAKLGYPFLADTMATSMLLLGTGLREAFVITGTLMMGLVYLGFVLFAWEMAPGKAAVALSFVLFFCNGGLGFLYVLDGVGRDPSALINAFEGYYQAPANMPDYNLRWVNIVCDMLIPQRTLLAGWMMLLPALFLLSRAVRERNTQMFACLGVWAGAMPLVHTHSFLALGLLSAGVMAREILADRRGPWRKTLVNFLWYGVLAVAIALPQLMHWTFPQTVNVGSVQIWFNWVNNTGYGLIDEYFWFWIKNVGLVYLMLLPAALSSGKHGRSFAWGALAIYLVSECVVFQPNKYDNNKLFLVAFLAMLPLVGRYCVILWNRMKGVPGRALLASVFLAASTVSGAMSLGREAVSEYMLFHRDEVTAAEFLEAYTQPDALVLTGEQHNNPVCTLAGRHILCGTGSYLYYHGLDYRKQQEDQRAIYENPAENMHLLEEYGIEYIYISSYERSAYFLNEAYFRENFPLVFSQGDVRIYAVYDGES